MKQTQQFAKNYTKFTKTDTAAVKTLVSIYLCGSYTNTNKKTLPNLTQK